MNILIVYAHHEPSSYVAAMKNTAVATLSAKGHNVLVSDLYGQGFNPAAQKWDFVSTSGGHFNYMLEQRHAAALDMAFSPDILAEIQKVKAADMVMFITPIWWFSVPAILKGWFDRVLAMGVFWDGGKIYENGLLRGKQAMILASGGGPEHYYQPSGLHRASITQILHPINHGTLAFCGLNVHEPYVVLGVLGGEQARLENALKEIEFRLEHLEDSPQWLINFDGGLTLSLIHI